MDILLIAPGKAPEKCEIDGELKTMQDIVGGTIQAIFPFDDSVALICNDDSKLLNLPPNRALYDEDGALCDIVVGTFFLCDAPPDSENFASLSDKQIAQYTERFASPEQFLLLGGHIVVVEERAVK